MKVYFLLWLEVFFGLIYFIHMKILPCMYACLPFVYLVREKIRREHQIPWTWNYSGCELPHGSWVSHSDFLQEQPEVLSLSHLSNPTLILFWMFSFMYSTPLSFHTESHFVQVGLNFYCGRGRPWTLHPPPFTCQGFGLYWALSFYITVSYISKYLCMAFLLEKVT